MIKLSKIKTLLVFLLSIIATKFYVFNIDSISWDESTYYISGLKILEGQVPYIDFWELKPPLVFYLYSLPPLLFGEDIVSFRISSIIIIFISTWQIYNILSKNCHSSLNEYFSHVFILVMAYYFWSILSTELLCLPFLLSSYSNFTQKKFSEAGFMVSLATLIRLNLAYLVVGLCLYLMYELLKNKIKMIDFLKFITAGLIPLIIFSLYYFFLGEFDLFYTSNVDVNLSYISERGFLETLIIMLKSFGKLLIFHPENFLLLILPSFLLFIYKFFKRDLNFNNPLAIYFFFILLSIVLSRQGFTHHFILLIPFIIFFIVQSLTKYEVFKTKKNISIIKNIIFISLVFQILLSSSNLSITNKLNINAIKDAKNFLQNNLDRNSKFLSLDYHLLNSYFDMTPSTPIIHTPALLRNTTSKRIKPLVDIGYLDPNHIENILNEKYKYIICSDRICKEKYKKFNVKKINDMLINYKIVYKLENSRLWEFKKITNLIIYERID
tara:strand:- start:737 stop:2224 length:1488 start_codon:yes stop_codon:yes gene_type:complete